MYKTYCRIIKKYNERSQVGTLSSQSATPDPTS